MTTLVTGATGLVGNNVVRLLLEQGEPVRVLVRENSDPRPLEGLAVSIVHGDVRDVEAVRQALNGAERVIHSAAQVQIGWTGLESQRAINVEGTRNVAVAAREAAARMVHVSSVDALGIGTPDKPADEDSPRTGKVPCSYVITKREAEAALLQEVDKGLDAVIVNPGFMLGPWDWKPSSGRMLLEVARRFTPLAPKGGCSVCDVRDVAAGIVAALAKGRCGHNYILSGSNLSYLDLWKRMARVSGGSAPICRAGPLMRLMAGRGGDVIGKLTGREPDVNSAALRMSDLCHFYSCARAERELNYSHRDLDDTLRDAWLWFTTHGYV